MNNMKKLIMLSAFPASGKTTWAKKYQKEHENVYILNSDDIRMELTAGDYHDRSKQKEVWDTFDRRIHEIGKIDDVTLILDAVNDTNAVRMKYLSTTPEFDYKVLVMFPSTLERSKKFNKMRPEEVRVPDDIIEMMFNKFEQPSEEVLKLVNEVYEVRW